MPPPNDVETPSHPQTKKRNTGGCHTCRVRKVKCRSQDPSDSSGSCSNCKRLDFECRWEPPAEGEAFAPPPKRRRTFKDGRPIRNRASTEIGNESPDFPLQSSEAVMPVAGSSQPQEQPVLPSVPMDTFLDDIFNFGEASFAGDWGNNLEEIPPPPLHLSPTMVFPFEAIDVPVDAPSADLQPLLLRHYLEVMKGFAKVEDRDRDSDNLYISAFARSFNLQSLFNAILAYSASHLAISDATFLQPSGYYANLATLALQTEQHTADLDAILATIFILVKREHMLGSKVEETVKLLQTAGNVIRRPDAYQSILDPRSFSKRVIQRLLLLDCRASIFGLGGGEFVSQMETLDTALDVLMQKEHSSSAELLRGSLLRKRVGDLDKRLRSLTSEPMIVSLPVTRQEVTQLSEEIQRGIKQFDVEPDLSRSILDSITYNRYMTASLYHSTMLYLDSIFPLHTFDPSTSVSQILRYQLAVKRDPSRSDSPSSIWPSSLFFAGSFTTDVIHRQWVIERFRDAEKWGSGIRKARELLEVIDQRPGSAKDIGEIMRTTTGEFIL